MLLTQYLSCQKWRVMFPILLLAVVSLGCGISSAIANLRSEPEFAPTRTPFPTFTPTPAGAALLPLATPTVATEVDVPSEAAEQPSTDPNSSAQSENAAEQAPGETAPDQDAHSASTEPAEENTGIETAPEDTSVVATILQNMNIRGGPGTNYRIVGSGKPGDASRVIGRNPDNSWVQVEYPATNDGVAWVFAGLLQIDGNLENVAVAQAPPPPPPTPAPAPVVEAPPPQPEAPRYQFTPTGWYATENEAIVHFKGRIKDEGGNLVNGYSVYVSNGAWGTISHPTGASYHYPEKGDGEWDVAGIGLFDGQGWWWLSVVRYDCDFWALFDAQCKEFTRLSEEVKIEVRTPEESVINADWICHWDCNKGLYTESFRR